VQPAAKPVTAAPSSPHGHYVQPGRGGAMRGNLRGSPRARGASLNGAASGRGGFASPNNRRAGASAAQMDGQIDPNSFERPRGGPVARGGGNSGAGAGRKLWVPT
jgi:hypothetical protein